MKMNDMIRRGWVLSADDTAIPGADEGDQSQDPTPEPETVSKADYDALQARLDELSRPKPEPVSGDWESQAKAKIRELRDSGEYEAADDLVQELAVHRTLAVLNPQIQAVNAIQAREEIGSDIPQDIISGVLADGGITNFAALPAQAKKILAQAARERAREAGRLSKPVPKLDTSVNGKRHVSAEATREAENLQSLAASLGIGSDKFNAAKILEED